MPMAAGSEGYLGRHGDVVVHEDVDAIEAAERRHRADLAAGERREEIFLGGDLWFLGDLIAWGTVVALAILV